MDATHARFMFMAQMNVQSEHEQLFHEVYDAEHVPALLQVPGVRSVRRYQRAEVLKLAIGGEVKEVAFPQEPLFTAVYELDSPEILASPAWGMAVEQGRWPSAVRPFTSNRRHTLHRLIVPSGL